MHLAEMQHVRESFMDRKREGEASWRSFTEYADKTLRESLVGLESFYELIAKEPLVKKRLR